MAATDLPWYWTKKYAVSTTTPGAPILCGRTDNDSDPYTFLPNGVYIISCWAPGGISRQSSAWIAVQAGVISRTAGVGLLTATDAQFAVVFQNSPVDSVIIQNGITTGLAGPVYASIYRLI